MSNDKTKSQNVNIKVMGRCSFPALFKPRAFDDKQEPKYSLAILMDKKKDAVHIKALEAGIAEVLKLNNRGSRTGVKVCLREGTDKPDTDGYGDNVRFINASNKKKVPVVDTDNTPLDESSGKPYGGCYVQVLVQLWFQSNKFGKRVNAQLRAVRFVRDGEPFGDKGVDPNEVFKDDVGGDEPADDGANSML